MIKAYQIRPDFETLGRNRDSIRGAGRAGFGASMHRPRQIKAGKGFRLRARTANLRSMPSAANATDREVLDIFTRTRALLTGHFVLRSGLHSGHFFQCAQVCQYMPEVERLGELLVTRLRCAELGGIATVLAPAMGGLVIGQEVARRFGARYIFAEKDNNKLVMRRGFTFAAGERVLVVEDVITRGGRVQECLDIIRAAGATAAGIAVLVDRSAGQARFDAPVVSLLELSFPTYPADELPPQLAAIPASKPGS
jgi:orotate phosphoribosyltransferase